MNRPLNFNYKGANKTVYKNNVIYEDHGYFTAFITNNFYRSLADCKRAITVCIKNGWKLRSMSEVTEIIHQAVAPIAKAVQ